MKKFKYIYIIIVSLLIVYTPNVFAITEIKSRDFIQIDGKQVKKYYDNTITGTTNRVGGDAGKIVLIIDGKEYVGFCIDFGMKVAIGQTETPQLLKEYFQNVLSEAETNELIRKLTLFVQYGYGYEGRTTDKYYLATQQLIWEAISNTGFYASDFYHNQSSIDKLKINNFRWTNDSGKTTIDISEELKAIENSINEYYKTPSFCSAHNKIELEVGESAEFTDNNNVLTSYVVKCDDGIKCEKDNNKLKVTAIDEVSSQKITFTKSSDGVENYVYRLADKQGIITKQGKLETVSCEFGIDSFKNVQTSDSRIIYIITLGLFCGVMSYITYYTKKSLDGLK